jgi:hypothetical protein
MVVAREFGMEVTNRISQIGAHQVGKVEARRIVRALQLPPVMPLYDYLLLQEVFIIFLGSDLIDYRVIEAGNNAYQVHVQYCFAYENTTHAGVADQLEWGIFAQITDWLETLGLVYETKPSLGMCLKAQRKECIYTVTVKDGTLSP